MRNKDKERNESMLEHLCDLWMAKKCTKEKKTYNIKKCENLKSRLDYKDI